MNDYRDRIYAKYASSRQRPSSPQVAAKDPYFTRLVREFFPADRTVCVRELGAGQGALLLLLEQCGYRDVVGYDVSAEQVDGALPLKHARLEREDIREALAAMPDNSVDVMVAIDLLEHFTKAEAIALCDAVHRTLKPGGRWVVHCPNGESPFSGRIRYGDFTHEVSYTRQSIRQLLHACHFVNIVSREDEPTRQGIVRLLRWCFWKLIRLGLRFYIAAETGYFGSDIILSQNFATVAFKART